MGWARRSRGQPISGPPGVGPFLTDGQADQVVDCAHRLGSCQVADAPMQVQAELPAQHLVGRGQPVADAALLEQGQVQLRRLLIRDRKSGAILFLGRVTDPR